MLDGSGQPARALRHSHAPERRFWAIEHVALPYAWNVAAEVARRNGRPDRARWIEMGRA